MRTFNNKSKWKIKKKIGKLISNNLAVIVNYKLFAFLFKKKIEIFWLMLPSLITNKQNSQFIYLIRNEVKIFFL